MENASANTVNKEASWLWTQLSTLNAHDPDLRLVTFFSTSACYVRSRARFYQIACGMAAWLKDVGVDHGDYVAIDASLRFESLVTWCACLYLGAIAVFYPDDMRQTSREADAAERKLRVVITEDPERTKLWFEAKNHTCKKIKRIVYMDVRCHDGVMIDRLIQWPLPDSITSFESCVESCEFKARPAFENLNSAPCAVTFSQGSTVGERPVELTHAMLLAQARALSSTLKFTPGDTIFAGVVCVHAAILAVFAACVAMGAAFAFSNGKHKDTLSLIEQTQPQLLFMLPGQISSLAQDIMTQSSKNVVHARWNDFCVLAGKFRNRNTSPYLSWSKGIIDTVCLRHLKNRLGPTCRGIVSFGAAINTNDAEFFSYLDIPIYNGYVTAEIGGFAHLHRFADHGGFLDTCKARIRHGKLSLQAIGKDEFVFTGDYVFEDERIGLCIKRFERLTLANGQDVDTTALHENLVNEPLIQEALIFGDGRPYLTALIYLDPEQLKKWAAEHKISEKHSFEQLCQNSKVYKHIKSIVDARSATRSQYEEIRKIALLPVPLDEDPRVLTRSGLVRRYEVKQRYAGILNSFYNEEF